MRLKISEQIQIWEVFKGKRQPPKVRKRFEFVVLTANQVHYIINVVIKTAIVISKKQVFATSVLQNLSVLWFSGQWTDANDHYADTFSLRHKKKVR